MDKVFLGLQVDKRLRDEFRAVAKEKHMTMSGYIKLMMADAVKKHLEETK